MKQHFTFDALGCQWQIKCDDLEPMHFQQIEKIAQDFEANFSRFRADSETRKISNFVGKCEISPEMAAILQNCSKLNQATSGKFTPLIGQTLNDMGYDENYSLNPKPQITQAPDFLNTVSIDKNQIDIKQPVQFDFGGLGKGYLIDKIADYLRNQQLNEFMINGSGDIYHSGTKVIRAGLEDPQDPKKIIGITAVQNASLCASSKNRRSWGEHSHIVDPTGAQPDHEIIATWVMAKEATIADALATSLFFTSASQLLEDFDFEFLLLNKDYKIHRSPGFMLLPPT